MTSPGASAPTSAPFESTTGKAPLPPRFTTRASASSRSSSARSTASGGFARNASDASGSASKSCDAPT
jgi:hypothetical protein